MRVGDNSFMVSKQTATGFQTAVGITSEVMQEASQYCVSSGKNMVIHNMQSKDGVAGQSYATVRLTFGCYDKNDPVYIAANPSPSADVVVEENQKIKVEVATQGNAEPTGNLYQELIELDDLRKRGILTEEEFAAKKRELLEKK